MRGELPSIPRRKKVHVTRVAQAWESGAVVNPDGLRNQNMGAIVQGIGGALFEAITFEDGRITNPLFSDYRLPRFADAPKIDIVLLDRKDITSAGAGETEVVGIIASHRERDLRRHGNASADLYRWRRSDAIPGTPKPEFTVITCYGLNQKSPGASDLAPGVVHCNFESYQAFCDQEQD